MPTTPIRGKNKIKDVLTLKHAYKYYIKDLDKDSRFYITYKQYRDICESCNKEIINDMLDANTFKLPYRLGALRVKAVKMNYQHLKFDYGIYAKQGIKAVHLNEHSREYYVRYHWHKKDALIVNKQYYSFIPTRANSRRLAQLMKDNGKQIKFLS